MKKLDNLSVATTFEVDDTFDSERFIKLRARVCHDGINPNGSNFALENIDRAKESIVNIPILAYCYFDEDGKPQFDTHAMHIEEDKVDEDQYRMVYDEVPIGCVPESCDYEVKEYNGKNYVFVDCFVWKNYSNYAQNIIERDMEINISMEIAVDSYKYNKKMDCFDIIDYRYTGITLLGNDVGTGMLDAKATISTFDLGSAKEKMIILMQELKEDLDSYNKKISEEGGQILENTEIKDEEFEVVEIEEEVVEIVEMEEIVDVVEADETPDSTEEIAEEVIEEVIEEHVSEPEEDAFALLQKEFEAYKITHSTENEEVERLKAFELKTLDNQRDKEETELFARFEKQLSAISEFTSIKEKSREYSIENLEEKLFALLGKKNANFAATTKPSSTVKIPVESIETVEDPYGGLLARVYNK